MNKFSKEEIINLKRLINGSPENHFLGLEILINEKIIPEELIDIFRNERDTGIFKVSSIAEDNTLRFDLNIQCLCTNYNTDYINYIHKIPGVEKYYSICREIENLPESFGTIDTMKNLRFSNLKERNNEEEWFGVITQLKNLEVFSSGLNSFHYISESIGKLKKLKELIIESSVTSLPDSIFELENLEKLNLRFSRFTEVPRHIYEMKKLSQFSIKGSFSEKEKIKLRDTFGSTIQMEDKNDLTLVKYGHPEK